ncbi:MAG: hypothetical protein HIU84_10565 [Acidobacteria bacterium]|nr:hypothetical protein [Acidobacteriota bacterium]
MEENSQPSTQTFGGLALAMVIVAVAVLVLACIEATTYSFHTMGIVIFIAVALLFGAVKVWQPVDTNKR